MSSTVPTERPNGFRSLANKISKLIGDKNNSELSNTPGSCKAPPTCGNKNLKSLISSRLDNTEHHVIEMLYDELHTRSSTSGIDKEVFRDYFTLPALWTERLFSIFDTKGQKYVDLDDFVNGLSLCCRGTKNERIGVLFKMFDLNSDEFISKDELLIMLSNVPNFISHLRNNPGYQGSTCDYEFSGNFNRSSSIGSCTEEVSRSEYSGFVSRTGTGTLGAVIDDRMSAVSSDEPCPRIGLEYSSDRDSSAIVQGDVSDSDQEGCCEGSYLIGVGPSPIVSEILAQVNREEELELAMNDTEVVVDRIMDTFDASGKDALIFEEFKSFIERNTAILQFFCDGLSEDAWSLNGLAVIRDNKLNQQWYKIKKFFGLPGSVDSLNSSPSECVIDATPESLSEHDEKRWQSGLNQVSDFMNELEGYESCAFENNTLWGDSIQCPRCLTPLLVCPKCNRSFPRLNFSDSNSVTVDCLQCTDNKVKQYSECWHCCWLFNNVLQMEDDEPITLDDTVMILQDDTFVKVRCLCSGRLLYYYTTENKSIPSGFIYLESCFLEKAEVISRNGVIRTLRVGTDIGVSDGSEMSVLGPGIQISAADTSSGRAPRIIRFFDTETRDIWFDNFQSILAQQPITSLYEMQELIGHGKFSVVYSAKERKTEDIVAIKVISKKRMNEFERCLLRSELNILRLLRHPNVISLRNVVSSKDTLYIVMEYVRGGELFSAVSRTGPFTEALVHRLILQMLKTLDYLHRCGIAHRDMKPENVLITSTNLEKADTKIADFGLACLCGPDELLKQPCGTLAYAAPEILTLEGYTTKVDMWALGVLTYLMLCGKLPFPIRRDSGKAVLRDKENFYVVKFKEPIWEDISDTCKDFITNLLNLDQKSRLSSKEALSHVWIKHHRAVIQDG